ncbi:MAG: ubiquinone-dependent pyruvate dehydrogenase, partial [Starkeya sp.]|nr:ubiquinone-dependent pyruvate dehydrogenase [Starkeya sp.]
LGSATSDARAISPPAGLLPPTPVVTPAVSEIEAFADLLNGARRVTLFCGRGCAGAHAELMALAEAVKSPIVHALGGKEYVEYDNPYDVGMTGFIGFASGYEAMHACDLLVLLGTDFPYKQFLPTGVKTVQVDIRAAQLGRRCTLDLGLVGDVRATLAAVLPLLRPKTDRAHLDDALARYKRAREGLDALAAGTPGRKPIHPQYLAKVVSDLATEDAAFTFDVGTPTIWAARYLAMNGKRRLVGSLVHGSMANAMPQAIGIQAAQPGRQVVSLSGDGGFAMLMGDLLTLVQEKLPVKIVIFNNGVLGFVAMEMKAAGFVGLGTDLENPDFAAMARAIGLMAVRVEDPGDLPGAVRQVFDHDGPALLDVVTAKQELSMPPTIGIKEATGFGLWLLRAVMSGRGDEVIDLAKQNLLPR